MSNGTANPQAEWAILSSLLSKPSLIGEVVGKQLEPDDFTDPAARVVYAATLDRYYSSDTVDPLIVGELAKPELAALWGQSQETVVQSLQERVRGGGYSDNTLDHAMIVRRLSTTRQLASVAADALMACQDGKLTPSEIGDRMSSEALRVTSGTVRREEMFDWMDLGRAYLIRLRDMRRLRREGREASVYTGLNFIDDWTKGIAPGELCFLAGDPGAGKHLSLDTPLPTPSGWTTMGEVQRGDVIYDERGLPTLVTGVSEIAHGEDVYELEFDDGAVVKASGTHTWVVSTRATRSRVIKQAYRYRKGKRNRPPDPVEMLELTTEQMYDAVLVDGGSRANCAIQLAGALVGAECELPLDPYVLGVWLAEGDTNSGRMGVGDLEIVDILQARGTDMSVREDPRKDWGYRIVGLRGKSGVAALRAAGVLGRKHIPAEYLRASIAQRRALLAGLVDGDGWHGHPAQCEIVTVLPRLRDDLYELATSLGLRVAVREARAMLNGRDYGPKWTLSWSADWSPFWIERKARGWTSARFDSRYVVAIRRVPAEPVKCLAVAAPSRLYLCGRAMIPTHNSAVAWESCKGFAQRQLRKPEADQVTTLLLSMEMGEYPTGQRFAQGLTGIDGMRLREADIGDREYDEIRQQWANLKGLPIRFNFASNFRLSQMRALIVEGIRRHNVGFVVIDHFRMLDPDKPVENGVREDEVKVRFLKEQVAKDLNVAVMCLAHTIKVGRNVDGGARPRLSDLRGSGQISAAADMVGFLHRPFRSAGEQEQQLMDMDPTDAELVWAKNRYGTESVAPFRFDPKTMRLGERVE